MIPSPKAAAASAAAAAEIHVDVASAAAAASASSVAAASAEKRPAVSASASEISPRLLDIGGHKSPPPPRMGIFSVSHPRNRSPREFAFRASDTEFAVLNQIILWAWSGSRYSGVLCMASSATIYYIMEVLADIFPGTVQSIPLFETVFTRCTIVSILSVLWLRKTGQPLFAPAHTRILLIARSLSGLISLLSFIYSIQHLPLAYAIVLNFTTPILASIGAKIILKEKWAVPDIGGLAFSFLGVLFVFWPTISMAGSHHVYPVLLALFSSAMGGICYCLIQAGAKASDQLVYTVLSFGVLASPVSAICTFALQEFVLPNFFTFCMMVVLSFLAFFAQITLARGLQLEKISKVTNILYVKVILSRVGSMIFLGMWPSFSEVVGFLLILASVGSSLYLVPEKEIE